MIVVGFEEWAVLVPLQDGTLKFRLYKDLVYHADGGSRYIVPRGFSTDLASVPRFLWAIYPPYGKYTSAAVLHDYLCESEWVSRKDGDKLFLEAMKHSNVGNFKRTLIYLAVRMFALLNLGPVLKGTK